MSASKCAVSVSGVGCMCTYDNKNLRVDNFSGHSTVELMRYDIVFHTLIRDVLAEKTRESLWIRISPGTQ